MKIYTAVVLCAFFLLTALFAWKAVAAFLKAGAIADKKPRRSARRSALLLLLPGVMFLSAALFILTRIPIFLDLTFTIGGLAVVYVIAAGLRENVQKHGNT